MPLDYDRAAKILLEEFGCAETALLGGASLACDEAWIPYLDAIFTTYVQAYREALIGCALARLLDRTVDIRLPYVNQGDHAYNGRTLDERVVNPFLQANQIPCSKGPFLAAFRRSVRFDVTTREGLRDKTGYDAFLALVAELEQSNTDDRIRCLLQCLLYRFAKLREASEVQLSRVQRLSLEQFERLIGILLAAPSGGRIPVILVVAALHTINDFFLAGWKIEYQDINVADSQTGAGGDVTVKKDGAILFAAEITERPLLRDRVVQTFHTKIAPNGIADYLFFVRLESLAEDARQVARQYFAQGHEVSFLAIKDWITMQLATVGAKGRALFLKHILQLFGASSIPRSVKVAWNQSVANLMEV